MSLFEKSLNPLYKSVDKISDFSDVIPSNDIENEEFPYFSGTESYIIAKFRELFHKLKNIEKEIEDQIIVIENETGDDKAEAVSVYNKLLSKADLFVDRINRELDVLSSPYFGKIRIRRDKSQGVSENTYDVYIGKFACFDENTNKLLITDWRAPITNVYYENSGPKKGISFKSPIGNLTGDLLQKRQFDISDGRIHKIYDAKTGNITADAFLLTQLTRRIGKKLKDIVATIQNEQNEIIRSDIDKSIILQGVAGSGKTTIVLHRLAYLLYTYPDRVNPEKSLIIAPNRMFLDYISDVLPSLGIKNIESNTFLFWAKKILGLNNSYTLSPLKTDYKLKERKGNFENIDKLLKFFDSYEDELLQEIPFSESDVVYRRYFDLKKSNPDISVKERLNLAVEGTFVNIELKNKLTQTVLKDTDVIREKINKYIKVKTNVFTVYKQFIRDKRFTSLEVSKYTLERFIKKTFTVEDLAPLVVLQFLINGNIEHIRDYIVVDEAQDMSPFEIFALAKCAKRGNLFLAGDIAQSIIPPFYIKSWDQINELLRKTNRDTDVEIFNINKCYRTTVEIIEYTNTILSKFFPKDYTLPEAVLRHGDKVKEFTVDKLKDMVEYLNSEFDKGAVTTAIITKNEGESSFVFDKLKRLKGLKHPVFSYSDSDYRTGILVLPISKAKGLEFDSVLILNPKQYNLKDELDVREYYVASTRPLHRLYLVNLNEKIS